MVVLVVAVFAPGPGAPPPAAARALEAALAEWDETGRDLRVHVVTAPRAYDEGARRVSAALREIRPDLFLLYDTDAASEEYKLHQLAANYDDDPKPDAAGEVRRATIIHPPGPVAYRSRLPLDGVWDKFMVERVPVRMAHKATHVLNHVYYEAMRCIDEEGLDTRGGAIETPGNGAGGRDDAALREETRMILAVLRHLYPALLRGAGTR